MTIFKNKNFTKRDYECTNIVFCAAEKAPNENWIESSESDKDFAKCSSLYVENGVRFFGFM